MQVKKLFANLLKYKENAKVSVGIKFGNMISLLISYGKWMIIYFNLPLKGKRLLNKRSCGK